ncbi:MAG TPA: dihydroorotase [Azospirillaceae bacterium]|nr:dihydroorotase [Azospirillaceae bacterium]
MKRTAYLNARLLDPATGLDATGALLVEGERIADLGPALFQEGVPEGIETIDCAGLCLAPGLVDMRAQIGEPGFEQNETIRTAGRAAAAGGVTALACLPNTDPVIDDLAGLEYIARRAREARTVKVFAYGAVTRGLGGKELTEMGLLAEAGAVGFTDGTKAVADPLTMRRALSYASTFGKVIVQHPEEPRLATGVMNGGEIATRLGLSGIPAVAEVIMLERDLRLVELTGGRYHASHVSTAESVEVLRRAKARGLRVTADTAPPYFALTEVDVGDYRTFFKLSPPLRGEMDRRAIVEGLEDGTIDCIASDHSPHNQDEKRVPFNQAAFGAVGLETLLPLTLELVHKGRMSLLDALAAITCRPADVLGLPALGRLAKGGPADLVLFDPDMPWKVDADRLLSKSKNSCFDKRPVQGKVMRTVVDGRVVFGE